MANIPKHCILKTEAFCKSQFLAFGEPFLLFCMLTDKANAMIVSPDYDGHKRP